MKILFKCKEYKRIGFVGQYSYIALCDVGGEYDETVKRTVIGIQAKLWMPGKLLLPKTKIIRAPLPAMFSECIIFRRDKG